MKLQKIGKSKLAKMGKKIILSTTLFMFIFLSIVSAQTINETNASIDPTNYSTINTNKLQIYDDEGLIVNYVAKGHRTSLVEDEINRIYKESNALVILYVTNSLEGKSPTSFVKDKFYELGLDDKNGVPLLNVLILYVPKDNTVRIAYGDECGIDKSVVREISGRLREDLDSIRTTLSAFQNAIISLGKEIDKRIKEDLKCERNSGLKVLDVKLNDARFEARSRTGDYGNNKNFIDGLFRDGIIYEEEYNEINGVGATNNEEDMEYVRALLGEPASSTNFTEACGCKNIVIKTVNGKNGGPPTRENLKLAHEELAISQANWIKKGGWDIDMNMRALGQRSGPVADKPWLLSDESEYELTHAFEVDVEYHTGSNQRKCVNGQVARSYIEKPGGFPLICNRVRLTSRATPFLGGLGDRQCDKSPPGSWYIGVGNLEPLYYGDGYSKKIEPAFEEEFYVRDKYRIKSYTAADGSKKLHWIDVPFSMSQEGDISSIVPGSFGKFHFYSYNDYKIRVAPDIERPNSRNPLVERDSRELFRFPFPGDNEVWHNVYPGFSKIDSGNTCHCDFNIEMKWEGPETRPYSKLTLDRSKSVNCNLVD